MEQRTENSPLLTAGFIAQRYGERAQIGGEFILANERSTTFVAAGFHIGEPLRTAVIEFSDDEGAYSWFVNQHPDKLTVQSLEVSHGKIRAHQRLSTLKFKHELSFLDFVRPDDINFKHRQTTNNGEISMLLPEWTSEMLVSLAETATPLVKPVEMPYADLRRIMSTLHINPSFDD